MIPLHLRISGFLSYRDPTELDFNRFDLACISGQNGAGKSSLLDAITWALFGEARGRGAEVINLHPDVKAAEVAFTFKYEGNVYRIQRTLPRGKNTLLEFQIQNGEDWKALTERTTRDTQGRIEQILRLDYETFINASFFLQGKADQFTQKKAGERKAVLSSILGLEVWDSYKDRTAERRKELEREVDEIDGRQAEIEAELSEEEARRKRLTELESSLKQLSSARAAQESALEAIRKTTAALDEQRKLAAALAASLERSRSMLAGLQARCAEKEKERTTYMDRVNRAREIEAAYLAWHKSRSEVEHMETVASQFREHQDQRQPLLREIDSEKARLEEEKRGLLAEEEAIRDQGAAISNLKTEIDQSKTLLQDIEKKLAERTSLERQRAASRERQAELKAENDVLKLDMNELKVRIEKLKSAAGAECPLCGQPLSKEHRRATLKQLENEGKSKGDRYRLNQAETNRLIEQNTKFEARLTNLTSLETERLNHASTVSQLTERMETLKNLAGEWKATGRKRLAEVTRVLEKESYASESRKRLTRLDKELAKLGYDASAHDAARAAEAEQRASEEEYRALEKALAALQPIEDELRNLNSQIPVHQSEIDQLQKDYDRAGTTLKSAELQAPDMVEAERELLNLREQENQVRDEVGAARQKVDVLGRLRTRREEYRAQREILQQGIARHKTLERAFGRDGVPALLIEQALPQIETKANDLLDRLTDGRLSIRFVTQAEYKDRKRDDLKETLDIQISDAAGVRDYEMYSGGEAFRINFAIRLALSEILSRRKGARLQTLVIDEGFGSQDTQGRQRLIEAINLVKDDFAKILVITHLDELKDAFPNRIDVEKTERGSTLRVL
jgi:exonuclease SbcC